MLIWLYITLLCLDYHIPTHRRTQPFLTFNFDYFFIIQIAFQNQSLNLFFEYNISSSVQAKRYHWFNILHISEGDSISVDDCTHTYVNIRHFSLLWRRLCNTDYHHLSAFNFVKAKQKQTHYIMPPHRDIVSSSQCKTEANEDEYQC